MKFSYLVFDPVSGGTTLADHMRHIAAIGYQGIELVATNPLGYELDDVCASEQFRLPVVSLMSGWSYANEGLCMCSPAADIAGAPWLGWNEYVGYASRLGSVLVVGLLQGLRRDEPDERVANDRIVACLKQLAPAAAGQGVTVVIEPVNHHQVGFNHTAAEVVAIIDRVGSPAISYMLDTIHMHQEEHPPLATIAEHGPRIRHFHLADSNGGPLGDGNIDFAAALSALRRSGYDGFVSVKVYRKQPWRESARTAAEYLRGLGFME